MFFLHTKLVAGGDRNGPNSEGGIEMASPRPTIYPPLFSIKEIDAKFRQIGVFYEKLNGFSEMPEHAQIEDAVVTWFNVRFATPREGHVVVSQKDYDRTFSKLYGYLGRLADDLAVQVKTVVDRLLMVGSFDAKTNAYQISQVSPKDLKSFFYKSSLPEIVGDLSVYNKQPLVGKAFGEILFSMPLSRDSWAAMTTQPSLSDLRVMAFFEKSVADANSKKELLHLCTAQIAANSDLGLKIFNRFLQTSLSQEKLSGVFEKLNRAYYVNSADNRHTSFEAVFSEISDPAIKENLEVFLLLLANIRDVSRVNTSEIHSEFAGSCLHGCTVDTLDALLGRATDVVPANFLKLPFPPVQLTHLEAAYSVVFGIRDENKSTWAQNLGLSVATLDSRCQAIRHAYAKHTIYTAALKPEPSTIEKLAAYTAQGRFRTNRDIAASKYTAAEQGAASKLFDFYFKNKGFVVLKNGGIDSSLGIHGREAQALYGIAAMNKPAFDVLAKAAKLMGIYDRFLQDMQRLQTNPAVQKLMANRLRVDGSMSVADRAAYHAWSRFFSATLPGDLSMSDGDMRCFDACKDALPSPVRERVERGRVMSAIVGRDTACCLTEKAAIQEEKARRRALVFNFAKRGPSVFVDVDGDTEKVKSTRANFRNTLLTDVSKARLESVQKDFCKLMHGNADAIQALKTAKTTMMSSVSPSENIALDSFFTLMDAAPVDSDRRID